ncbi:hypothetical protein [Chitinophaga eiseniae]|uniref:Lipoprotein n=1 Tax=Chitinophaga eiseniae TaxID=634771 RepID=A0A847SMQ7_9BACT|nr:hypothetical protein [Chitinophaga eiseniae]NLR78998.1 hypothetical protein [Chitinophaga eiseniae]
MKQLLAVFIPLLLWSCTTTQKTQTTSSLYTNDQECATKIKDGWLTAKTISFGLYSTTSRKNGVAEATFIKDPKNAFNFYLNGNGEHLLIQTMSASAISFSNRNLPGWLNSLPGSTDLRYALINGTKNEPLKRWEMIVKAPHYLELNDNKPVGILRCADTDIRVTAHNRFGKVNSYENICYEFQYRGQPVAAVIPGDKPRVWVGRDVETEMSKTLAAAIAAFLFQ